MSDVFKLEQEIIDNLLAAGLSKEEIVHTLMTELYPTREAYVRTHRGVTVKVFPDGRMSGSGFMAGEHDDKIEAVMELLAKEYNDQKIEEREAIELSDRNSNNPRKFTDEQEERIVQIANEQRELKKRKEISGSYIKHAERIIAKELGINYDDSKSFEAMLRNARIRVESKAS